MMSKVAEGKGKTCGKNGKNTKCAEVQDSESTERIDGQLSKLLFEAIVNVFVSRLVLAPRKGNLIFNIMYGKVWFESDFFVQNLERQRGAPPVLIAFTKEFSFLDRMVRFHSS